MAFGKPFSAGMVVGLVLMTAPSAAQTALRAPLNIVPPPMQAVIGVPDAIDQSGGKLAPRVTARQMKRAVRAVASAPGAKTDTVQVGQLGVLQDAPVGLEVGLGQDLWRGARLAFITEQMARLPASFATSGLRDIELILHRSAAAAPTGTVDGTSWFGARLNRFLALGDTASVLALEALTGAASSDGYAARAVALAHLGRADTAAACAIHGPPRGKLGRRDTLAFFLQLRIYCQLHDGEFEKVSLAIELNQKTLKADRLFREMAFLMAAQAPLVFGTADEASAAKQAKQDPPLVLPSELTPMQIVMLQLAGAQVPENVTSLPLFLADALANDYNQTPLTQLSAAHAALVAGHMSAEAFLQISQLVDLTAFAPRVPSIDEAEAEDEAAQTAEEPEITPPAVFLAQSVLQADATAAQDQSHVLATIIRQAAARDLWRDAVLVLQDQLRYMSVPMREEPSYDATPDTLLERFEFSFPLAQTAAPIADEDIAVLLPALRYVGMAEKATDLAGNHLDDVAYRVVAFGRPQTEASDDLLSALQAFEASLESPSPQVIVANDADARSHPLADVADFEARLAIAIPPLADFMRRELAIYHGLDYALPPSLLAALALPETDGERARIAKLADKKWIGDLLLTLVANYGETAPRSYRPTDIVLILQSLRQAGLSDLADELAVDMLVYAAAELSLAAPDAFIRAPLQGSADE